MLRSYLYVRDDEDCDDILNRIVDDVHSSQPRYSNAVAFSMMVLRYRNGCAMIAFITEIQEQTDNRG